MTLTIDAAHRLVGPQVSWRATPNVGGALAPKYLVMHYTAGSSAESAIASLATRKPAGNASIGIEIDNAGALDAVGARFMTWFGREVPADEVMMAAHKHGGPVRPWHAYTALQIERCLDLAELLVQRCGLAGVIGHEDIAPGRKTDPGPAFPLAAVASRALGRERDLPPVFVTTTARLHVRQAPDAGAPAASTPLPKGTRVRVLEPGSRFNRIELVAARDVEGWVNNRFLAREEAPPKAARRAPSPRQRTARKPPAPPRRTAR